MPNDHTPIGQIGCIDGRVLGVSRHSGEVLLTADDTQVRLSEEAAARLADLLATKRSGSTVPASSAPGSEHHPAPVATCAGSKGDAPDPTVRSSPPHNATSTVEDTRRATRPTGENRQRFEIDGRSVHVRDLLKAGLLKDGEPLTWPRPRLGQVHRAQVLKTGQLRLGDGSGPVFDSPSRAAMAASETGSQPGWNVWCVADGRTLADLRDELLSG